MWMLRLILNNPDQTRPDILICLPLPLYLYPVLEFCFFYRLAISVALPSFTRNLLTFTQLQNLFLTLISSIFQLAALVWYAVSYFPMGSTGLQFMGRFGVSRVSAWVSG